MPNPASSGTGYLAVSSWIQLWGEAEAWRYMDALHKNISKYTHSGSKPCNQAASGEVVVGIAFDTRASALKSRGAPIEVVLPQEGVGWDLEGFAIVKESRNMNAAMALADWASGADAMDLYARNFAIVAASGTGRSKPYLPNDYETRLVRNDFNWAAANRDRILREWLRRYDCKSEPR